jgi:hypothetical protein
MRIYKPLIAITGIGVTMFGFAGGALSATAPAAPQPALQFSDLDGVKSWRAGGDTVVFVKSRSDQWYKAEMQETCMKLNTKKGIKFVTETDPATLERFSAVVVDRHICRVTSLSKSDSPDAPK